MERKRRDRIAAIEDEQEQTRLAEAGDPEAQAALLATSSVLGSIPIGDSEEIEVEERPAPKAKKNRRVVRAAEPPAPPKEEEPQDPEQAAYDLMDVAYRKWASHAKENLTKANRELAIDLGKDTALYLRSGIIRLADLHDTINKLTAVGRGANKEESQEEEDYDGELEDLRKRLRG